MSRSSNPSQSGHRHPRGTDIDPRAFPIISTFFRDFLANGEFSPKEGLIHFLSTLPASQYESLLSEITNLQPLNAALRFDNIDQYNLKHGEGSVKRYVTHLAGGLSEEPSAVLSLVCDTAFLFIGNLPQSLRYQVSAETARANSPVLVGLLEALTSLNTPKIDSAVASLSSRQRRAEIREIYSLYREGEERTCWRMDLPAATQFFRSCGLTVPTPFFVLGKIYEVSHRIEFGSTIDPLHHCPEEALVQKATLAGRAFQAVSGDKSAWETLTIPFRAFIRSGERL